MAINVLICDDSTVMRSMVKRALQMTGLSIGTVEFAEHGGVALECLEKSDFDLLLLDVNMPVLDGLSALRRIRECAATKRMAVVAVTSEGSEEKRNALRQLRASVIAKPFTAELLVDGILEAMRNYYEVANGAGEADASRV